MLALVIQSLLCLGNQTVDLESPMASTNESMTVLSHKDI
jgi:hypothetical protein